jgi:hypothetical protein
MADIIARNADNVSAAVMRLNDSVFEAERSKIRNKEKSIVLPDISDELTKAVQIRRATSRGDMITENLKNKLTQDLRDILSKPDYLRRRGALAGTLKDSAISEFQDKIKQTFEGYTRIDPSIGVPPNIRNIAVTEVRSVVQSDQA